MVYALPSIYPREWPTLTSMRLWHHLFLTRRPDLIIIKKRTCKIVDFPVPFDDRIKVNESEKNDKYLDLARELKKNMAHKTDNYTNRDWCCWYCH